MGYNDFGCNFVNVAFIWQEITLPATTQAPTTRAPAISFGSFSE